jgi:hypothetical protein
MEEECRSEETRRKAPGPKRVLRFADTLDVLFVANRRWTGELTLVPGGLATAISYGRAEPVRVSIQSKRLRSGMWSVGRDHGQNTHGII